MALNDRYLTSFIDIAQFIEVYAKNMLNRKDAMGKALEAIYDYISLYEVKIYNYKGEIS